MIRLKQLFTPVASMDVEEARAFMAEHPEGTYTILDVRQPGEYEEEHLPGAKLIPLPELHQSAHQLDAGKPIIVHCAVGGRSRVAAQLLSGLGFKEVYNLKGGIKAWHGHKTPGPRELNLERLRGDETPSEVVVFAYGMEKGLQTFYMQVNEKAKDAALKGLLARLIEVEENHKKRLLELHAEMDPSEKDLDAFDADAAPKIMEGGFDIAEFMEQNGAYLAQDRDVIELALMLETQALDLYLRYADKSDNAKTKEVLFRIADEEKAHLASLGRLLEGRA